MLLRAVVRRVAGGEARRVAQIYADIEQLVNQADDEKRAVFLRELPQPKGDGAVPNSPTSFFHVALDWPGCGKSKGESHPNHTRTTPEPYLSHT